MPKEPGEPNFEEQEKLIDFSHLTDEELGKKIKEIESGGLEHSEDDEIDMGSISVSKTYFSLLKEYQRRADEKDREEK